MTRGCRPVRARLMTRGSLPPQWVSRHLEQCDSCAGFRQRLDAVRSGLADHHGGVEPDAGFVGRVLARRPDGTAQTLGWAAARLLPVGVALALTLAWVSWSVTVEDTLALSAPTEDPLSWVLEEEEAGR